MSKQMLVASILSISIFYSRFSGAETTVALKGHMGIINEHHGILTIEDTKRSDEGSFAATPFDGKNSAYPYWQCFNKKHLSFKCRYQKPLNKQGSSLDIEIETKAERHLYSHAHAISGEICDEMRRNLTKILHGQLYFCINGTNDAVTKDAGKKEYSWSLYRVKTKLGYVHYFQP